MTERQIQLVTQIIDIWRLSAEIMTGRHATSVVAVPLPRKTKKTIYYADVITKEVITKVSRHATVKYEERHGNASLLNVRNLLAEFYASLIKEMAQKNKVHLFH